ncbi:dihydropteroate synthase [Fredinandcohnia sp. SECRCQ15]|uniref:Dihydropteroate synthase n=2 Tax=Fredinandcohnia quinoae TaxID=2918902 RepID=A0AAW5E1W9_9BACI|nr:dihydropteroate synthase [Fredinandcohnia sp. SECRCQ15]MCH1626912.1 dihydropteroate synthase [Fredinandcohnia sp. SECRCQ15]
MVTKPSVLTCGNHQLDFQKKTLIMGILNITPDSFSDGGNYVEIDQAIAHAKQMVQNGADIIDVGGESTRPGHIQITEEEEINRVVPIIKAISKEVNVPISIDTYKAEVAKQAIEAGAHIINDIWGAKADPNMAKVAAQYNVPIILMHNRDNKNYNHLIIDMISDLQESISIVKAAGVKEENIILDPGIGFAKHFEDNIMAIQHIEEFVKMGYPVLLGTSRKSFIGQIFDLPPHNRMEGTGATTCFGIQKGCAIVRVHDVLENARLAKMMDVLVGKGAY